MELIQWLHSYTRGGEKGNGKSQLMHNSPPLRYSNGFTVYFKTDRVPMTRIQLFPQTNHSQYQLQQSYQRSSLVKQLVNHHQWLFYVTNISAAIFPLFLWKKRGVRNSDKSPDVA